MKSNQDLPAEVRQMLLEAAFWDWWLANRPLCGPQLQSFIRWHSVEAHRVMLVRVYVARKRQAASVRRLSILAAASSQSTRPRRWARVAAGLLAVVLAQFSPAGTPPSHQIVDTGTGAGARPLEDGSIVRAAANTRIEIHLGRSERSLSMFRGEAFFDVAHEPDRPFVVRTPDAIITAKGTRFGVSIDGAVTVVTVTEGTVDVAHASGHVELHTDEQAQVSQRYAPVFSRLDSDTVLAWATTIAFDEASAIEALHQFSARSGLHMRLKDPRSASATTISGTFQLDKPMAFAAYVANRTSAIVSVSEPEQVPTDIAPRGATKSL